LKTIIYVLTSIYWSVWLPRFPV